jgi:hypothetical protein
MARLPLMISLHHTRLMPQGRGQFLLGQLQGFQKFIPENFSRRCGTAVAKPPNVSRLMVWQKFQNKVTVTVTRGN